MSCISAILSPVNSCAAYKEAANKEEAGPLTRAPCAPSASAMARPMPREPPVTKHTGLAAAGRRGREIRREREKRRGGAYVRVASHLAHRLGGCEEGGEGGREGATAMPNTHAHVRGERRRGAEESGQERWMCSERPR